MKLGVFASLVAAISGGLKTTDLGGDVVHENVPKEDPAITHAKREVERLARQQSADRARVLADEKRERRAARNIKEARNQGR